jgi:glycosyltransferase involved in cell wall biosynthesis
MNVVICLDARFARFDDGSIGCRSQLSPHFIEPYLEVWDEVKVLARVRPERSAPCDILRIRDPRVEFWDLPDYNGGTGYLQCYRVVRAMAARALSAADSVILRVPGHVSGCAGRMLQKQRRPYAVEVVGDPYDVFAPGVVRHPLRPVLRRWLTAELRRQCFSAAAAAYVTQEALQRRYPPGPYGLAMACSDVDLSEEAFVTEPRHDSTRTVFRVVTVGSLAQRYKGVDVLLRAIRHGRARGMDLRLTVIGDGQYRAELEVLAEDLGVAQAVQFLGKLSAGAEVRKQLDQSELFVLASRTEGLPRALVEAMARGLPCIGTTVGGIPELLDVNDMVPPGDAEALARKMIAVLESPQRRWSMAVRNLQVAREYHDDVLRARRREFYSYVREMSEQSRLKKAC